MKKILMVTLMVMVLTVSQVFAGGGKEQETVSGGGGSTEGRSTAAYDKNKILDITWLGYNWAGILPKDGSLLQQEFEKKYNIRIKNVPVDTYNREQLSLLYATGLEYDVRTFGGLDVKEAYENGLIRPLPESLVTTYAPAFVEYFDSIYPKWRAVSTINGALYALPFITSSGSTPLGLSLRTDWLQNLGIKDLPKTLDDLENILVRFRNDDPDRNGQKDTYGLSLGEGQNSIKNVATYIFGNYGVNVGSWSIDTDGSPLYWAIQPEYREALGKVREWYAKEIYDPEGLVRDRRGNMERFASGKTGGYFGIDWLLVPTSSLSGWFLLKEARPELNAETMFTHIPPVTGPKGKALTLQYSIPFRGNNYVDFGKNASDEKVVRILSMFNDIQTDLDLYIMTFYGFEGQHFTLDADGFAIRKPEWESAEKQTELGLSRFFPHQIITPDHLKYFMGKIRTASYEKTHNYPVLPIHPGATISTDASKEFGTAVDTLEKEYFWKVVTGEWDLNSTWNNYVSRWKAAGGQQMIDEKKVITAQMGFN
jgi:putative aldouronate transport system substrate-binding protein